MEETKDYDVLRDFFVISHWQTLLVLIFLFGSFIGLWYITKKFKLKFQYRVFIGLGIGLIFGLAIAGGMGFPGYKEYTYSIPNPDPSQQDIVYNPTWGSNQWAWQANEWFNLFMQVFISGLSIMILPVVFLAMARIASRQAKSNLSGVTWKGIVLLLINVAIGFAITFWLGMAMNIGSGMSLGDPERAERSPLKPLTQILTDYMPSNFFGNLMTLVVVPLIILGAIIGYAIKKSTKRHPEQMAKARENLDRYWTISISVLMTIIKFMPYAIITMFGKAIFSRPIAEFATIGSLIGLGYLGLGLSYLWLIFTVWLFGVSPKKFTKHSWNPVLSGFLTQSSLAVLPMAMDSLKKDMKLGEESTAPNVIMPLSTTLGLMGCAGVQSGVILTLLNNAKDSPVTMTLGIYFLLGLIVTLFASLGIAGVPGTATIVTLGVVSTIGFPAYTGNVINVISPLNGIFDMGRTAINVKGGLQASVIAAAIEDEMPQEMLIKGPLTPTLKRYHKWKIKRAKMRDQKNQQLAKQKSEERKIKQAKQGDK